MLKRFQQVEAENLFIRKNLGKFSRLSEKDKAILHFKLKAYNFESIAVILNASPEKIKGKYEKTLEFLGFESEEELIKFARTFKII